MELAAALPPLIRTVGILVSSSVGAVLLFCCCGRVVSHLCGSFRVLLRVLWARAGKDATLFRRFLQLYSRTGYNVIRSSWEAFAQLLVLGLKPGVENSRAFYARYHGHDPSVLRRVCGALRTGTSGRRSLVWLVGDSSLDNKAWVRSARSTAACNGYEHILQPARSVPDVAYLVNSELVRQRLDAFACVNAAVEESTVEARTRGRLLPQDEVVRDLIAPGDVLVVSVGGNDIALRPTPQTVTALSVLLRAPLRSETGLSTSLLQPSGTEGFDVYPFEASPEVAAALAHFDTLFGDKVSDYVASLCGHAIPALVVVCMVYYPHALCGGWADRALAQLGYDTSEGRERVQLLIRTFFARATCGIRAPHGAVTSYLPLFTVLDPSLGSSDYVARVEPSVCGGRKIALEIVARLSQARLGGELQGDSRS